MWKNLLYIKKAVMKAIAKVEREIGEKNFSCHMNVVSVGCGVLGTGNSAKAAIEDMLKGWEDMRECLVSEGREVPVLDIEYSFDIGSLFSYYDFLNLSGVSREIGISPSVVRQYVIGVRKPSVERKREIADGIKRLARKIQTVRLY